MHPTVRLDHVLSLAHELPSVHQKQHLQHEPELRLRRLREAANQADLLRVEPRHFWIHFYTRGRLCIW